MKVLALDYGRARTGMAVSDSTGTLARPLTVVQKAGTAAGMRTLLERIAEQQPQLVVVGLPLTLRGEQGEQARETLAFVERLRGRRFPWRRTTSASRRRWRSAPPARSMATMRWPPPTCSRDT